MANYRVTPLARCDLEAIWHYTKEEWDADQADRYLSLINSKFEGLAQAPLLAPSCDHIRPGYRRSRAGQHMIYYRISGHDVIIIRILHAQMDERRHL